MSGFRKRLLKGSWLQLIVLRVLYDTPLHGYRLLDAVNALLAGRRKLKSGSLYTILRRMEHSGLLTSTWETRSQGLNRRIYTLTPNGLERLRQGRHMIAEQQKVLAEMAEFYRRYFRDTEDA
jgi:DNA-binding PadR family transcriptional regulator